MVVSVNHIPGFGPSLEGHGHLDANGGKFFSRPAQGRGINHGKITTFGQCRTQISHHNLGAAAARKDSVGNENVQ